MTLDVLEPQTEALETQAVETPDPDLSVGTETAEPASDPLAAYEAELGLTQTSEAQQGETAVQNADEPSTEVLQQAERIANEREQERQRVLRENGVINDFNSRAQRMRAYLTQVASGRIPYNQLNVEAILSEFSNHHGQIAPVTAQREAKRFSDTMYEAAEKEAPGVAKKRDSHKSTAEFMKDFAAMAREGYVSKKEQETALKAARVEEYKRLAERPEVLRALLSKLEGSTGGGGSTTTRPSGPISADQVIAASSAQLQKWRDAGLV